jgi:hypothetical protein
MTWFWIKGLSTAIISGNAAFNSSVRPLFVEALIARILRTPLQLNAHFLTLIQKLL